MNNPGSILKLWVKAVTTHEKDKDAKTLPKKGQEQKSKIKMGLTTLKFQGATDLAKPANAERFVTLRDKVGKLMTRYCRYLKAAKDEDKKILPKYLKTVTQLTAVVLKLDPGALSQSEEEPSLESLAGVDVAAVEQAMAAPDTGGDIDLDAPSSATPQATDTSAKTAPPTPPQAKDEPKPDPAAAWAARRKAVEPQLLAALKGQHPNASQLRSVFAFAVEKAEARDYTKALQGLDNLAKLLSAPTETNGAADQHKDLYLGLMSTLPNDLKRLKELDAAAATKIAPIVTAANGHATKGDYKKAFTFLNQAATALAKSLGAARAQEAAGTIPEGKVAAMREALLKAKVRWDTGITRAAGELKKVQDGLRVVNPALATALTAILEGYRQELLAILVPAEKAQAGDEIERYRTQALKMAASLKAEVSADPLLARLDAFPLSSVQLQKTMDLALTEIQTHLAP